MKTFALLPLLGLEAKSIGSGGFGSFGNPRMKKILSSSPKKSAPSSTPEKFKVHIVSKQCSDDDDFFYGEKCGEWKCAVSRSEFSQCVLELSQPELTHFNPNQKVKRSCQCHMNTMGFRLFTGCQWRVDELEPRKTTTTTTTTTSTTTSTTTTTTTTTTTPPTTKTEIYPELLFDLEIEENEKLEEFEDSNHNNLPQISSDHEEIFIDEFARCGRDIPALARLTCNMFSSARACSVTCPSVFETNNCECHNGHCFWELPFNRACYEQRHHTGLSSFEVRGAKNPQKSSFPVFDAPSKTSEDGVYVQAFDLFQQMQRMMYESGYFNIFLN